METKVSVFINANHLRKYLDAMLESAKSLRQEDFEKENYFSVSFFEGCEYAFSSVIKELDSEIESQQLIIKNQSHEKETD